MNAPVILEPPAPRALPAQEEPLYEVVNGQRVELPPMSIYANSIAFRIAFHLESFSAPRSLGTVTVEALFILDSERDLRRRPDVAFVAAEKWPPDRPLPETGDWEMVPDLAVEVISPNDLFAEVVAKMEEYFRLGVRQVWIVSPANRQVYVYDSPTSLRVVTADQELDGGTLLPGLRLSVGPLFQRQTPAAPVSAG